MAKTATTKAAPAKAPTKTSAKAPTKVSAKAPAKKLTKTEIIRSIAEQLELPNKQVGNVLGLLAEMAAKEAKKNGEFLIPGFGKLVKAQRAARMGRNPATGETIKIKAKTTVKFRVAKAMKDAIAPPKI